MKYNFVLQRDSRDGWVDMFIAENAEDLFESIEKCFGALGRELGQTGGKAAVRLVLKSKGGRRPVRVAGLFTIDVLMTTSQVNALFYK